MTHRGSRENTYTNPILQPSLSPVFTPASRGPVDAIHGDCGPPELSRAEKDGGGAANRRDSGHIVPAISLPVSSGQHSHLTDRLFPIPNTYQMVTL